LPPPGELALPLKLDPAARGPSLLAGRPPTLNVGQLVADCAQIRVSVNSGLQNQVPTFALISSLRAKAGGFGKPGPTIPRAGGRQSKHGRYLFQRHPNARGVIQSIRVLLAPPPPTKDAARELGLQTEPM